MIINLWSGPRNISTALMRSFENRMDTNVIDEPFYAYYLKTTGLKHPMYEEIIQNYETKKDQIIKNLINNNNNNKITLIKHMTHHITDNVNIDWIKNTKNFFLIRHPKKVINSYIKKNTLKNINDLGFNEQLRIFNFVKSFSEKNPIVINANKLLANPETILKKLCNKMAIKFDKNMINWPKGKRSSDGIWSIVWYHNVINSYKFEKENDENIKIPNKYKNIFDKCLEIYLKIDKYSIK